MLINLTRAEEKLEELKQKVQTKNEEKKKILFKILE